MLLHFANLGVQLARQPVAVLLPVRLVVQVCLLLAGEEREDVELAERVGAVFS